MAKGENLEKPKKGGMVIVIGVGKPKKKSDIKKSGPRMRSGSEAGKRAKMSSFREKVGNLEKPADSEYLNTQLKRFDVPGSFLGQYLEHKHGKNLVEALKDDDIDVMRAIKEASGVLRSNKGQMGEDGRLKDKVRQLLERRQISPSDFKQSLRSDPFMEFRERVDELASRAAGARMAERHREQTRREMDKRANSRGNRLARRLADDIDPELSGRANYPQMFDNIDRLEEMGFERDGRRNDRAEDDKPKSYDDEGQEFDENIDHGLLRILQARYGHDEAARMAAQLGQQGYMSRDTGHFTDSVKYPGKGVGGLISRQPSSINPEKTQTGFANPYANLGRGSEEEEGEGDFTDRLFTQRINTSSDSTNVMDEAWALLKQGEDYGDVSIALDERERQRIEEIKRKNREAAQRNRQGLNAQGQPFRFPRLDNLEDPNERSMLANQNNIAHSSGRLPQ